MDREQVAEFCADEEEVVLADGFEEAFIGLVWRLGMEPVAMYDYDRCLEILIGRDGLSEEEAIEHLEYNVMGAWVGDRTPAFCRLHPQRA